MKIPNFVDGRGSHLGNFSHILLQPVNRIKNYQLRKRGEIYVAFISLNDKLSA